MVLPACTRESVAPAIERFTFSAPAAGGGGIEGDVNAYRIGGPEGVLVDSGYDWGHYPPGALPLASGRPRLAILTHGHPDHVGGVDRLLAAGIRVLAHHAEAPVLQRAGLPFRTQGGDGPPAIEAVLSDGESFCVAGHLVQVLHVPGHTPGHLCLVALPGGVLLSGDAVLMRTTTWIGPPDGDLAAYLGSLKRLAEDPRLSLLLPAHGPAGPAPAARIREIVAHRQLREEQILDHLRRAPATATDLAHAIYAGEVAAHVLPFARATVLAHLDKLIAEGRVRALSRPATEPVFAPAAADSAAGSA